jgi:hypothetical protein
MFIKILQSTKPVLGADRIAVLLAAVHESLHVLVLDAGNDDTLGALTWPASKKAPRHEVAGSWAPAVPRALWGSDMATAAAVRVLKWLS